MIKGFTIRETSLADVPEIVRHRRAMFDDMAIGDTLSRDRMEAASGPYLRDAFLKKEYFGWFALAPDGKIAGGVGILLQSSPPRPWEVQHQRAYLLNLYVYPEYRRRGVAKLLVETSVGWCRDAGYATVSLHASEVGRGLYASLGFHPTNEMRLRLQ